MLRLHHADRPTPAIAPAVVAAGVQDATAPLPPAADIRAAIWVDLVFPLPHEREAVEAALGIDLPSKADMIEIEASSRAYRARGATIANILLVVGVDSGDPAAIPVSLILTPTQLVTVRYADPQAFRAMDHDCTRDAPSGPPLALVVRLMEHVVDRTADILERMGAEIDSLSNLIFGRERPKSIRLSTDDLQSILRRLGNTQFVVNKVHDSLTTLVRALSFMALPDLEDAPATRPRPDKRVKDSLKSLSRDVASLLESSNYHSQNLAFLLDAALGRISIEQNAIIKIFSVAAVVFLPPTLVGTIYGMNFVHMPELEWVAGYPMAIGLMIASAIIPYLWFKQKGWL